MYIYIRLEEKIIYVVYRSQPKLEKIYLSKLPSDESLGETTVMVLLFYFIATCYI